LSCQLTAELDGNGDARQQSYPSSGPVSTGMGDCLRFRVAFARSHRLSI